MSQVPPLAWLYNVDLFDNVITRDVFLNKCFTVNYAVFFFSIAFCDRNERNSLPSCENNSLVGNAKASW